MARMIFGPWMRISRVHNYTPNEVMDVCCDAVARTEWIDPASVQQARWLPSPRAWVTQSGDKVHPHWVRRREWADPHDIGVMDAAGPQSISLEMNQDGSATIVLLDLIQAEHGKITIAAADLETVAQWFTKAVEANKQ